MGQSVREIEATPELVAALRLKVKTCFMCLWMVEDFELNKKFTGYPIDYNGKPIFPIEGKILHLEVENLIPRLDV